MLEDKVYTEEMAMKEWPGVMVQLPTGELVTGQTEGTESGATVYIQPWPKASQRWLKLMNLDWSSVVKLLNNNQPIIIN